MKCTVCKKGVADGVTIHRNNAKGQPGVWRCWDHLDKNMKDPEVKELTDIIEEAGKAGKDCPQCGSLLMADEHLEHNLRCPVCQSGFFDQESFEASVDEEDL